jgi:hypothetical protein
MHENVDDAFHIIYGTKYYLKFLPDPSFTDQNKNTVRDRWLRFDDEVRDWDYEFWESKALAMGVRVEQGLELLDEKSCSI